MLIFKIWQKVNNDYDTYSDAIVVANSPEEAKFIHPSGRLLWNSKMNDWCYRDQPENQSWDTSWTLPNDVEVELVGLAHEPGSRVLCSSYHAG